MISLSSCEDIESLLLLLLLLLLGRELVEIHCMLQIFVALIVVIEVMKVTRGGCIRVLKWFNSNYDFCVQILRRFTQKPK